MGSRASEKDRRSSCRFADKIATMSIDMYKELKGKDAGDDTQIDLSWSCIY